MLGVLSPVSVRLGYLPLMWYTKHMNTTDLGRLGEIKVAAQLVSDGWYVFFDQSGKCEIDLIAWKDGEVKTVQVKSTGYRVGNSWLVQLKTVRPNRTGNTIRQWSGISDLLGIYLIVEDRVLILESSSITQKNQISIPAQNAL